MHGIGLVSSKGQDNESWTASISLPSLCGIVPNDRCNLFSLHAMSGCKTIECCLPFDAVVFLCWALADVLRFVHKTLESSKVLQFSRNAGDWPACTSFVAAVVIVSVWTAIDPWGWERVLIQETPAETYGECTSDHFALWFLLLTGLTVFAKFLTIFFMAWKTADIQYFRTSVTLVLSSLRSVRKSKPGLWGFQSWSCWAVIVSTPLVSAVSLDLDIFCIGLWSRHCTEDIDDTRIFPKRQS